MRGRLDASRQFIRHEVYQWPLLLGILCLVLSVVAGRNTGSHDAPRLLVTAPRRKKVDSLFILCVAVICVTWLSVTPATAVAAPTDPQPLVAGPSVDTATSDSAAAGGLTDSVTPPLDEAMTTAESLDPRDAYNRSLSLLATDADAAESLLQQARRQAGNDGEVRFRAGYNLGWVEIERADRTLASDPQQALLHLRLAADWFREAIRLRPKNQDARQNLELVMRRSLELADSLARNDGGTLAQQLDELIGRQRELLAGSGQLVERLAGQEREAADGESARRDFRGLATTERQILSDTSQLLQQTAEDLAAMQRTPADDQTDEDRYRAAQLEHIGIYLPRATQRLGQAAANTGDAKPIAAFVAQPPR